MRLDAVPARVVGSLIEKQLATPQQYPLTLNALVAACNQASNREPVLALDEAQVIGALEWLKDERLVRFVLPSHGRSAVRYRHVVDEATGLDSDSLALFALLLLRGPQTAAELRARSDRLAAFDDSAAVLDALRVLGALEAPLAELLPRRPGQKEERWATPAVEVPADGGAGSAPAASPGSLPQAPESPTTPGPAAATEELTVLVEVVQELAARVDSLEADLRELRHALGA